MTDYRRRSDALREIVRLLNDGRSVYAIRQSDLEGWHYAITEEPIPDYIRMEIKPERFVSAVDLDKALRIWFSMDDSVFIESPPSDGQPLWFAHRVSRLPGV